MWENDGRYDLGIVIAEIDEAIADATFSEDVARLAWVRLDLLAQIGDV